MASMNPVNVYAESTPNPSALKFVSSRMLLFEGSAEFHHPSETTNCPLATGLFAFSGVKSVFITSNFITVTKDGDVDWYEITNIIREYIRGFLMAGDKIFLSDPNSNSHTYPTGPAAAAEKLELSKPEEAELEQRISQILEEYVKPAVEQDGGEIRLRSFQDGVVTVSLRGSCSGCPSSTITLKSGIENLLKSMLPEVREVVAEAD
jgi:Fe-S cluster biogenesis protein NfuA